MKTRGLKVRHVYSHEANAFEAELNTTLREVAASGGEIVDVQYAMDPASQENRRGGFGALVLFEPGSALADTDEAYG
ncbi:MAG: hypothetical protein AB2A00_24015 [Myxococcota bacterium]